MAEHKMVVLNGVRYRPDEVPKARTRTVTTGELPPDTPVEVVDDAKTAEPTSKRRRNP